VCAVGLVLVELEGEIASVVDKVVCDLRDFQEATHGEDVGVVLKYHSSREKCLVSRPTAAYNTSR